MKPTRRVLSACALGLLVVSAAATGLAVLAVRRATRVPRVVSPAIDFGAMGIGVEPVTFSSVDGLTLAGWEVAGQPSLPPIVLAHDLGSDKAALAHLALLLNERGFPLLLFDFRGHGESEWGRTTLGLQEKRDVLGAVDHLAARGNAQRVGVYGVGLGAFAAVLAAADRSAIDVLVLDGLYPSASYPLKRRVFGRWHAGARHLAFLPEAVFAALNDPAIRHERADEVLRAMSGRDVLLIASTEDAELAVEMQVIYEGIPAQRDADGNFTLLPASQSQGLYGDEMRLHHQSVVDFFASRLRPVTRS
jgi:pimeloyl-ACP methyl ester carboxylesterase